ncbi:hypothetical protein [Aestuariibacter sp. A3R04]|uniref:hypothetical protein n=1 Tax=Aestuariibacter sp. A3R04 TaxID=2841571 RepID=UPI001C0A40D2|nr:hypothetical protein [Aestuariibacter sp. A3R04]MBU3022866.1 hypothetical protein [Aestuariibacter sp. A3R04]
MNKDFLNCIECVTGAGFIPQDLADAALEIVLSETDEQLIAAARRYQNLSMIAARGQQMKWQRQRKTAVSLSEKIQLARAGV